MKRPVNMPLWDWPVSDRAMWAALIRSGDPLDDAGALSHVRATTQMTLSVQYGRWLEWLFRAQPDALAERPEVRATPERLIAWIESLSHVSAMSRFTFLDGTMRVLRTAAPDLDWSIQSHLVNRLRRDANRLGSTRKTGRILSSGVLLQSALDLAGPQADAAKTSLAAALNRRDGTMVAFLALLPIRRRSFSELELGSSVLVTASRISIALSGDMTKNGHTWETQVPDLLEPLLRRYIDEVRPLLMARGNARHDFLWVGKKGEALGSGTLGPRIAETTLKITGVRVPPHFFRDAAATTLARMSPKDSRLIRPLLAHAGYGIAERHYIQACCIEAGRDYAAIITQLTEDNA